MKNIFNKEAFGAFLKFENLLTEKLLTVLFKIVVILSLVGGGLGILGSWLTAFTSMADYGYTVLDFFGNLLFIPLGIILAVAIMIVFLRLGFESMLIHFLNYRELYELNAKE
ncbi:MAG: DUF4282 domain-containing protein [Turicibacter sp.]|nr:DUF4282 domain-containing protein [Turicibacter sp.]